MFVIPLYDIAYIFAQTLALYDYIIMFLIFPVSKNKLNPTQAKKKRKRKIRAEINEVENKTSMHKQRNSYFFGKKSTKLISQTSF